jgi:hypothetical protein
MKYFIGFLDVKKRADPYNPFYPENPMFTFLLLETKKDFIQYRVDSFLNGIFFS